MGLPLPEPLLPHASAWRGRQWRLRERANGFVAWPPGREIAIDVAVGLVLGVIGPFGSYLNGPLPARLVYWVTALLLGSALILGARWSAERAALRWDISRLLTYPLATILAALPIAALSHLLATTLWAGPIRHIPLLTWYGQTLVIAAILTVVHRLAGGRPAPREPATATGDFRDRLPAGLGRDLLALQMEDHYVRAHTRHGSALILIPLHQAIRELAAVPGVRIHRSWWVARDAVVACMQDGRNVRLRLSNDLQAPVARARIAVIRAMGMINEK
jgi:hypothetical protein